MTDRTEYLELEVSVLEEHEKLWRLTERQSSSGSNPRGMQEDNPTQYVVQKGQASPAKAKNAPCKKDPQKLKPVKEGKEPKEVSSLEKAWAAAATLKKEYATVRMSAQGVQRSVDTDPKWAWAIHDKSDLDASMQKLAGAMSALGSFFLRQTARSKFARRTRAASRFWRVT